MNVKIVLINVIFIGGAFQDDIAKLKTRREYSEAVVRLDIQSTGDSVVVMSRNNKERNSNSYVDFVVMKMSQSKHVIDVADDISFWSVGKYLYSYMTEYFQYDIIPKNQST